MAFFSNEFDQKIQCKQAQPCINQMLTQLEKLSKWNAQLKFLFLCRNHGVTPKGLRSQIPKNIAQSDYGKRLQARFDRKILATSISEIYSKKYNAVKKIAGLKMKLRETFGLSGHSIEREEKKLDRIVRRKTREVRKRIFTKLDKLIEEKKRRILERQQAETRKAEEIKISSMDKKIIYNNSKRIFNQKEIDLLSLGLSFGITPKKFPLIEYIAATEKLCQSLEEMGDPDSLARAQGIRNLVSGELRKGYDMKIKPNLSKEEREILREIGEDETIIICPADKGKAIVIEDRETYIQKMYQQIEEGDYAKATKSEKTLLDNIHQKLVAQLKAMGLTNFKQRRPYLVTAPVMANMYLLIKVHKDNFPGRAVVSQVDDPTYLICKELTRILNPLDEAGDSFIRDSFHLKDMLKDVEIDEFCRLASLDIKSLYPKVPVKNAFQNC